MIVPFFFKESRAIATSKYKYQYLINVSNIISNISSLSMNFSACSFVWVRREANEVAYALAKYPPSPLVSLFCCNYASLPRTVWEAWSVDQLAGV
jgi:hypothetical protein